MVRSLRESTRLLKENTVMMDRARDTLAAQAKLVEHYQQLSEDTLKNWAADRAIWEAEIVCLQKQDEENVYHLLAYQRWCRKKGVVPSQGDLEKVMDDKC